MTQTTSPTEPTSVPAPGPVIPSHPSDILMTLIVAFLAPMFLSASAGDIGFARMAAIETVNAYRLRNQADLVAVAQIIAFGLAALGSLSLSMADDISLSMTLRLRGNANALNRSAEQNRRVLREAQGHDPIAHPAATATEPVTRPDDDQAAAALRRDVAAAQQLAAQAEARLRAPQCAAADQPSALSPAPIASSTAAPPATPNATPLDSEQRHQAMWAIAMVQEAGEISANILNLPPAERRIASIRAAALSSAANELLTASNAPPPIPHATPETV